MQMNELKEKIGMLSLVSVTTLKIELTEARFLSCVEGVFAKCFVGKVILFI